MRSIRSGILAWLPIRLRRGRGTQNRSQMLFLTYERESREKRALPNHLALPYANGPLHIGHMAGAYLPADVYVRYLRMRGEDVVFVGGTDEHGVPITPTAEREGKEGLRRSWTTGTPT